MELLKKILTAPGRAYRWLYQDEKRVRQSQTRGLASEGEPDANTENEEMKRKFGDYNVWEEIDDMRVNFFFGRWVVRRFKGIGRGREALAKEKAESEGREYKSQLQLDLEAVAEKREAKERLKAEKRRQKEERKRKA